MERDYKSDLGVKWKSSLWEKTTLLPLQHDVMMTNIKVKTQTVGLEVKQQQKQ